MTHHSFRGLSTQTSHDDVSWLDAAKADDEKLLKVQPWLETLTRPPDMDDMDFARFMCYAIRFFVQAGKLWKKDEHGHHKLVASPTSRLAILHAAHDDVAHKGFYMTHALIFERFWWPTMRSDIAWFICTCYLCQLRQMRNMLIPPVVTTPAPLFSKVYIDTMHLPKSNGYKYLVQGHCSLCHYPEFHKLCTETMMALSEWIFEDILCCWGTVSEIVSDNGPQIGRAHV